jgi:S1-C subfamily serine protease
MRKATIGNGGGAFMQSASKGLSWPAGLAVYSLGALLILLWLAPTAWAQRPRAGLGIDLEPDSDGSGVAIREVYSNGPADRGWLRSGDVIVQINEQAIRNRIEYRRVMAGLFVGDTVVVEYRRGKKKRTARLTVDHEPLPPGQKYGN